MSLLTRDNSFNPRNEPVLLSSSPLVKWGTEAWRLSFHLMCRWWGARDGSVTACGLYLNCDHLEEWVPALLFYFIKKTCMCVCVCLWHQPSAWNTAEHRPVCARHFLTYPPFQLLAGRFGITLGISVLFWGLVEFVLIFVKSVVSLILGTPLLPSLLLSVFRSCDPRCGLELAALPLWS